MGQDLFLGRRNSPPLGGEIAPSRSQTEEIGTELTVRWAHGYLRPRICRNSRGMFTIFLVAFLLPVMFFLLTLSLDLTTYYLDASKTQEVVDESAKYAFRFLPLQNQAEAAARSYASRYGELTSGLSVRVSSDWIELQVQRASPLTFARLLGFSSGTGQPVMLPIDVVSRVRGVPMDAMIVMDVSPYLAPSIYGNNAWGNPGDWPAAQYMQSAWWFDTSTGPQPDARGLTQQCFNPAFSAIKRATIGTFEFLSGFSLNQVGVGFYTGRDLGPVSLARNIDILRVSPATSVENREASFDPAVAPYADNRYCAAAAQEEVSHPDYQFPNRLNGLTSRRAGQAPTRFIEPSSAAVNEEYLDYLETREVIWSQVVRGDVQGNSPALLSEIYSRLLSSPTLAARGGLIDKSVKVGVVFAGDLPRLQGLRFGDPLDSNLRDNLSTQVSRFLNYSLTSNVKSRLRLYYVVLQHEGVPFLANGIQELQNFFSAQIVSSGVSPDLFDIKVLGVSNPQELSDVVLKALVLTNSISVQSI